MKAPIVYESTLDRREAPTLTNTRAEQPTTTGEETTLTGAGGDTKPGRS
jgi:hypothetical protein